MFSTLRFLIGVNGWLPVSLARVKPRGLALGGVVGKPLFSTFYLFNMEKVVFVTSYEAEKLPESGLGGLGGFFNNGMRWADYLAIWKEEVHPRLESLRAAIIEKNVRCNGLQHQNGYPSCPVFEDGTCATYSFRAWGDLMAAVWSSHDNTDYSYMDFYC